MNLYKKSTEDPYSFLVIDTSLTSDNSLPFRNDLFDAIQKLILTIDDKIRDKKLQHDLNREAVKVLVLSSGNIDKYEFLTGEEILPSDQSRIIKQAKFTYSSLGKAFERQINKFKDQGEKQIKAFKEHEKQLVEYSKEKEISTL